MATELGAGVRARICGLTSRAELNGLTCTLIARDDKLGRWNVEAGEARKRLSLKPKNLELQAEAEEAEEVDELVTDELVGVRRSGRGAEKAAVVCDVRDRTALVRYLAPPHAEEWVQAKWVRVFPAADESALPTWLLPGGRALLATDAIDGGGEVDAEIDGARSEPRGALWLRVRALGTARWVRQEALHPPAPAEAPAPADGGAKRRGKRKAAQQPVAPPPQRASGRSAKRDAADDAYSTPLDALQPTEAADADGGGEGGGAACRAAMDRG